MADIGDLIVRLNMDVGGARKSLTSIAQGFKGLNGVVKAASLGIQNFGERLEKLETRKNSLQSIASKQKELIENTKSSLALDKRAYEERKQKLKEFMQTYDEYVKKNGFDKAEKKRLSMEKAIGTVNKRIINKESWIDRENIKAEEYIKNIKLIEKEIEQIKKIDTELFKKGGRITQRGEAIFDLGQRQLSKGHTYDMYVGRRAQSLLRMTAQGFIEYESAFANVEKTVNGTDAEINKLNEDIQKMSLRLPESAENIANVAASAGQLNIAVPNIAGFTEVMIGLSSSTNLGNEAAQSLAQFANVMGMSQRDFDRLGSVIVDLGNNSATTEAAILEMGMRLAGSGKQIGMNSAEVMGLAAALSSVGIEAQAGGTAFSKVMSDMLVQVETKGKRLKEYAKVSGMSTSSFSELFKSDASSAINAFINGLATMNEQGISSISILEEMGLKEIRLRDALLRSSNASELFTKSTEMANRAWKENTALSKEVDKRNRTTDSRLKVLGNKGKQVARDFGATLLPTVENVIEKASGIADSFMKMDEGTRQSTVNMVLMAAAMGPVIKGVGIANMGIGKISSSIGGLMQSFATGGVKELLGGFTKILGPAGMIAAVAGLGYAAYKIYDIASGAAQARKNLEDLNKQAESMRGVQGGGIWDTGQADRFKFNKDAMLASWGADKDYLIRGLGALNDDLKEKAERLGISEREAERIAQNEAKKLSGIDKRIESLLAKSEKRPLNSREKKQLQQSLIERSEAMREGAISADKIYKDIVKQQSAEREKTRLKNGSVNEKELSIDTIKSATVARKEYIDTLVNEKNAQEQIINGLTDRTQREMELNKLNKWYNEALNKNDEAYKALMKQELPKILNSGEVQKGKEQLQGAYNLLKQFSSEEIDRDGLIAGLKDINFDEKGLSDLLTTIAMIKDAGLEDVFGDIDIGGIVEQFSALGASLKGIELPEELKSLKEIFGKNVPEETLKILMEVDSEQAQANIKDFVESNSQQVIKIGVETEVNTLEAGTLFGDNIDESLVKAAEAGKLKFNVDGVSRDIKVSYNLIEEVNKDTNINIADKTGEMNIELNKTPKVLRTVYDEWSKIESVGKQSISNMSIYSEGNNEFLGNWVKSLDPEGISMAIELYNGFIDKLNAGEKLSAEDMGFVQAIENIKLSIQNLKDEGLLEDAFKEDLLDFAKKFSSLGPAIGDNVQEGIESSKGALEGAGSTIVETVKSSADKSASKLTASGQAGGKNYGTGIVIGANSMLGSVRAAGAGLGGALSAGFNGALKIFSPSRIGKAQAGEYGKGVVKSLKGSRATVMKASAGMGNAVKTGFRTSLRVASPSKVGIEDSRWFGEGVKIGLMKNIKSIASTSAMVGDIMSETFKNSLDMSIPALSVPNIASYGATAMPAMTGNVSINTPQIVVREDADIDRIAKRLNELARRQRSGYGA